MIKASALLVALAIGLLVAGVLASSLLMVYVSIGVCAVAALLLAAGILAHWPEIFGRGESRPSGMPDSWPAVQVQAAAPVLASTQVKGAPVTGTAQREDRRARREDAGAPPAEPVDRPAERPRPAADLPAAGRSDDLWERVEEELGSAGKRDTGALSWPGTELPVQPEPARPGPAQQAGPPETPPGGTSAWIWGQGAGWQPSDPPDDAWPPPAAAFAGSPPARPGPAARDAEGAGAAGQDVGRPDQAAEEPEPEPGAAAAGPPPKTDATAPGSRDDGTSGPAPESTPVKRDAWDERPRWLLSVGDATPARPRRSSADPVPPASDRAAEPVTGGSPAAEPGPGPGTGQRGGTTPVVIAPPSQGTPAGQEPVAGEPAAGDPAVQEPAAAKAGPAGTAGQPPTAEQAGAGGPAGQEPEAEEPAAGRVEVTVVPGVARYHRSECILIRFLGADDLELMTRQQAEEAAFVPCRACQPDQLES